MKIRFDPELSHLKIRLEQCVHCAKRFNINLPHGYCSECDIELNLNYQMGRVCPECNKIDHCPVWSMDVVSEFRDNYQEFVSTRIALLSRQLSQIEQIYISSSPEEEENYEDEDEENEEDDGPVDD